MTTFSKWLDTFIDEKGLSLEEVIEVQGPVWGLNIMPLEVVINAVKAAPEGEQRKIHKILVLIDFRNDDVMPFFRTLASALAQ